MDLRMSEVEREAFLADLHVGVIALDEPGRGPLAAPIWYAYTPGGHVHFIVDRQSRKARLLVEGEPVTLVAQNETPPYAYVSVEGPVTSIQPLSGRDEIEAMAIRYLGEAMGKDYARRSQPDASLSVRMVPRRWLSVDYARMS